MEGVLTLNSGLVTEEISKFHGHVVVSGTDHDIHQHGTGSNFRNYDGIVEMINMAIYNDDNVTKDIYLENNSGAKSLVQTQRSVVGDGIRVLTGSDLAVYDSGDSFQGNVLLSGDTPTTSQNFRVSNIGSDIYSSSNSIVTFKWNYDDILLSGVVAGATVMACNQTQAFKKDTQTIGSDQRWETIISGTLDNKYLYFPGSQNQYEILAHSTATNDGFIMVVGSGISAVDATESNKSIGNQSGARIIDNADSYLLTVTRQPGTLLEAGLLAQGITQFKETYFLSEEAVRNPYHTVTLPTNTTYNVELIARKRFETSSTISLNENHEKNNRYYYKNQAYTTDDQVSILPTGIANRFYFANTLPDLGAGAVTATGTKHGLELSITGWLDETNPNNNAHEYEVIYTKGNAPTAGNGWEDITGTAMDSSYTRQVTKSRHIVVGLVEQSKISVAVWPLQNGQRVATAATASATGGAGGIMPEGRVIASTKFDLRTYQLTLHDDNEVDLSESVMSPYISGVDIFEITPDNLIGSVIQNTHSEDTGFAEFHITNAYWLTSAKAKIKLEVSKVTGSPGGFSVASGVCNVNNTEAGRQLIYSAGLPIDYQLTGASLKITGGTGVSPTVPGLVRIYQESAELYADYLNVTQVPSTQNPTLDTTIQGQRGGTDYTKTLMIDAYDDTGSYANNHCNLSGEITISAKPLIISSVPPTTLP
jgi:hypothetical protein